ncbi:ABC transporter ATP-binding protein [Paenibacillus sp.]|uniref:ABC transporter ATP-binding protein n=1 Tax=Paenibacillus sp. TaxID=58172 RepID=UPI002D52EBC2|nr:ABC transporter ATP-binding protein [Paenibacillus sp.]HZG83500.1 ABC transporter ATP-binding protein [Paenibacillus sp.]
MTAMDAKGLTLGYGGAAVIDGLDLAVPRRRITVLIGKNGCGKSTLLRSLARLLRPDGGSVLLDGKDIYTQPTKEVAKRLAILPQGPAAPEGLTVLQLVKQGRYPHQTWLKQWSREDERAVAEALAATGMAPFAERPVDSLSGGQRQRAWIAMTLAQQTGTILLDEPTTYLDMTHQIEVLELLADLNEREQRTIVMVLHDINLACRYAHNIVAVSNGAVYAEGAPADIVDEKLIRDVFGMECRMMTDPVYGTPMCIPVGARAGAAAASASAEKEPVYVGG